MTILRGDEDGVPWRQVKDRTAACGRRSEVSERLLPIRTCLIGGATHGVLVSRRAHGGKDDTSSTPQDEVLSRDGERMAGKVGAANDDWRRPILKLERPLLLVVDQEFYMAPRHAQAEPENSRLQALTAPSQPAHATVNATYAKESSLFACVGSKSRSESWSHRFGDNN